MGPPGSCRPQMGPMLTPWTLLSGIILQVVVYHYPIEASSIMLLEVYSHSWLTQFPNGFISITQPIHQIHKLREMFAPILKIN